MRCDSLNFFEERCIAKHGINQKLRRLVDCHVVDPFINSLCVPERDRTHYEGKENITRDQPLNSRKTERVAFWLWLIRSAATSSMWQRVLFFLRSCGAYRTCLSNRKLRILGHVLVLICFCSTLRVEIWNFLWQMRQRQMRVRLLLAKDSGLKR